MNQIKRSFTFRMGVLGAMAEARFSALIDELALKPKHVGLMLALDTGGPAVQLDVARRLGVAPSLVVSLADHLEGMGAIQRVRDQGDRRRQLLSLTDEGRRLLILCGELAGRLDAEMVEELSQEERAALDGALAKLAARAGLPT